MDDRFNTTAGWVLFAGIIALGASIVASETFHSERPEHMGYPIAGVAAEGGATGEEPIETYLAKADATKGATIFNKCAACHTITKGGPNGLGPNLWDVLGEPIGKGKGFAFSPALSGKGGNWDWHSLNSWLTSPRTFAPGTKMTFAGLGNPQERADVMAYINSQSDSPEALPAAPAPAAAANGGQASASANAVAPAGGTASGGAVANAAAPAQPKKP